MRKPYLSNAYGFSLIEVIAVLAILVIVSAIILSRYDMSSTNLVAQTEIFKNHLRTAQSMAMAGSSFTSTYGIRWDDTYYWTFQGNDPNANIIRLFDDEQYIETNNKLRLTAKNISISGSIHTLFFDSRGIPYSSYPDTQLASDLSIYLTPHGASSPVKTVTITQHTGFIP